MLNYQNGKIYTIRCRDNQNLIYVGSTIQPLSKRWGKHKQDSLNNKSNRLLYQTINNEWDKWYIELYELCPCNTLEELLKREGEVIRLIGNLNMIKYINETNAERQQRHREKLRANNEDAYKEKLRLDAKKHYYKNKNKLQDEKQDEKQEIVIKELKPISKRIAPLNKSILNDNTKKKYLNFIKKIYEEYHKKPIHLDIEQEFINNFDKKPYNYKILIDALSFLKPNLLNIIKDHYSSINDLYSVITRIKFYSDMVKILYPYILEKQIKYDEKRENKIIDDNIKIKLDALSFDKIDVLNNLVKLDNDFDRLIYGLFMYFPVRRSVDYRIMLISTSLPNLKDKNDKNNYYFNKKFYFLNTKNKKRQVFDIPDELDNLIPKDKTNNDYLLGKLYTTSTLSKIIMKVFCKVYGFDISALELRRFYATSLNSLDDVERNKIAIMMNHNLQQNKLYAYKQ